MPSLEPLNLAHIGDDKTDGSLHAAFCQMLRIDCEVDYLRQQLLALPKSDLSRANHDGWFPLQLAVRSGRPEVCELLIEHGADVNLPDEVGTPLHRASGEGATGLCELLVHHGADIEAISPSGQTALQLAVENKDQYTCLILKALGAVENGLEKTAKENDMKRVLIMSDLEASVNLLRPDLVIQALQRGADPISMNRFNLNALQMAETSVGSTSRQKECQEIINILRSHVAREVAAKTMALAVQP